jgi:hypothetical protein
MPKKLRDVLTPSAVEEAKPGRYTDGDGLQLLVRASGGRSWVFRFMVKGKSRELGLGSAGFGGISLATARHTRDTLRQQVKMGINPLLLASRDIAGGQTVPEQSTSALDGSASKADSPNSPLCGRSACPICAFVEEPLSNCIEVLTAREAAA